MYCRGLTVNLARFCSSGQVKIFSALRHSLGHRRITGVVQDSILGRIEFDPIDSTWRTIADAPIYHGGIPGNVHGPDAERIAEILERLGRVESYWQICAPDLLYIAACYASLPQASNPRQLFQLAALSLYADYWEVCFETKPEYTWIYVGMQFEDETLVSNTIDT